MVRIRQAKDHLRYYREQIRAIRAGEVDKRGRPIGHDYQIPSLESAQADAQARLDPLLREQQPFQAEWERRGGWKRYPFVTNAGGHYHRDYSCSTCFPTTEYGLHHQVSGLSEPELVEQVGHHACTVCFPQAPSLPSWSRTLREEQAAKDAKKSSAMTERRARLEHKIDLARKRLERERGRSGGDWSRYSVESAEEDLERAERGLAYFDRTGRLP
jgi:hypothetical protein